MTEEKVKKILNLNSLLVALLVIASFFIGSLYTKVKTLEKGTASSPTVKPTPEKELSELPILKDNDHLRGERTARILLFEYSDLECPFCKRFHETAKKVVEESSGKVAWVYRHFPLDQIHSKADKEAEATECANELGGNEGFWKLTDKIFEVTPGNNGLNLSDLPKLAAEVNLPQAKFKTCLESGKYAQHVEEDYQSGIKAGITGTPGNILLDTKTGKTRLIPGALPFGELKKMVDELLAES